MLVNTIGLVVCGGQSKRMGSDKSLLQYFDKAQRYHIFDMLTSYCEQVFLSCNANQITAIEEGVPFIVDHEDYKLTGPIAGLLSAFRKFPEKDILFIGCDYPFLTNVELGKFTLNCKGNVPVSFYNDKEGFYEPLLAWYPHGCYDSIYKNWQLKKNSLQQFLLGIDAKKYIPFFTSSIKSVDSYDEYEKIKNELYLKNS